MPVRPLPPNPNLDHLKYQAKDLLKGHAARNSGAAQRIREFHPRFRNATDAEIFGGKLRLSDAQLAIARESGFASWARLKAHIEKPTLSGRLNLPHHERIEDAIFRRAVDLLDAGDAAGLRAHLRQHPKVAQQHVVFEGGNYFRNPTLLEFVAENPTRRGTLPEKIVEVTKVMLDAGTTQSALDETLLLVASSNVARGCRVQLPLIDLLCDYGADPNMAIRTAAAYAEFEAVNALLRRGARMDLSIAAALGHIEEARRLLPNAEPEDRHWALAMASQFGHREIVRMLLDAGEDPNRYNPLGGHSHSTPLHRAAVGGHLDMVRLLVERGARLDWKDTLWQATPAEWARHEGRTEVESYLRRQETETQKQD
ncbi:MAG: ankyrin repeat domain-containing protein [Candidatus Korobacteraceae bacterium]